MPSAPTDEQQQATADRIEGEVGADLRRVLASARRLTGSAAAAVVASWPWPDGADPAAPDPTYLRWEHIASDDRIRIAVTAQLVQFSRPGPGLLFLDPHGPLWQIDLASYPAIISDLLGFVNDLDEPRYGLVAIDRSAGILSSARATVNGQTETTYQLCCWGL